MLYVVFMFLTDFVIFLTFWRLVYYPRKRQYTDLTCGLNCYSLLIAFLNLFGLKTYLQLLKKKKIPRNILLSKAKIKLQNSVIVI